jgi:hypothetical protein
MCHFTSPWYLPCSPRVPARHPREDCRSPWPPIGHPKTSPRQRGRRLRRGDAFSRWRSARRRDALPSRTTERWIRPGRGGSEWDPLVARAEGGRLIEAVRASGGDVHPRARPAFATGRYRKLDSAGCALEVASGEAALGERVVEAHPPALALQAGRTRQEGSGELDALEALGRNAAIPTGGSKALQHEAARHRRDRRTDPLRAPTTRRRRSRCRVPGASPSCVVHFAPVGSRAPPRSRSSGIRSTSSTVSFRLALLAPAYDRQSRRRCDGTEPLPPE